MSALIVGMIGRGYRVDMDRLTSLIDDGYITSASAETVSARLRALANQIDSEVLALRDLRDGKPELVDSETHLFEGAVSEIGKLGFVHDANGGVGVIRRVLGKLLRSLRVVVPGAHVSPSVGHPSVEEPRSYWSVAQHPRTLRGDADRVQFQNLHVATVDVLSEKVERIPNGVKLRADHEANCPVVLDGAIPDHGGVGALEPRLDGLNAVIGGSHGVSPSIGSPSVEEQRS